MDELLTEDELEALRITGHLANKFKVIIGTGPQKDNDWAEVVIHIHNIQHLIMAQAAARAYPDQFRLLGQTL